MSCVAGIAVAVATVTVVCLVWRVEFEVLAPLVAAVVVFFFAVGSFALLVGLGVDILCGLVWVNLRESKGDRKYILHCVYLIPLITS